MENERETIESRRDQMTAGPQEPQYDQMEGRAEELKQEALRNPGFTQGEDIPVQDVPEDERLQRPVATETDSY
jgi:hypothetical protein